MKVEALTQLLQRDNPGGQAYSKGVTGNAKKSSVCVVFHPGGKVYEYSMTVYRVAEKLGLIPEFNILQESENILAALSNGSSYTTTIGCYDTVRYYGLQRGILVEDEHTWSTNLITDNYTRDQFDREICTYSLKSN